MIRTLIVDDAALSRKGVRLRLADEPDVEIVGEAGDGPRAVEMIKTLLPDLIYLDVQMPGCDGFEVLERAGGTTLPAVIFVTAHDQYALRAFDARAIDYLLKPVSDSRFHEALNRVRRLFKNEEDLERTMVRLTDLLGSHHSTNPSDGTDRASKGYLQRVVVKDGNRFMFVKMDDVSWIQSDENYAILHTQERPYQARITMKQLEDQLDSRNFARIHRSVIVNIDRIKEILSPPHRDRTVVLNDGTTLPVGRAYSGRLIP